MSAELALPPLTADERAHSERLVHKIRDAIDANAGWISFERYMEMALYEPGLGYYSAGAAKLGAGGDFVTAPEISPLFSRCLAVQCAEILPNIADGNLLELGAGSGIMARDLLAELDRLGRLPARYLILEVSADLRERQRQMLAGLSPAIAARVQWIDGWPEHFRGVVLANEVLDAMPVHRFRLRAGQVYAIGVTWQLGQLDWSETHADPALEIAVREIERVLGQPLPDGYASEVSLRIQPWVGALAAALEEGVALFVDYGLSRREYYRADRREGTLLCHFRQRFHDAPLVNVGIQDIGAWVDFTALAEAAVTHGLGVAGYSTQAHFLIGNGIEQLLAHLPEQELSGRVQLARQAMMLTLPGEMGERFKVIGLTRNYPHTLRGFSVRDLSAAL